MILIADSGSTKTSWALVDQYSQQIIKSKGINPYYQDENEIYDTLMQEVYPHITKTTKQINQIYFYGAGCANEQKNVIVSGAIKRMIENSQIHIASDMLGAARALFGNRQGIACILGTGSNSCVYDGFKITENVSAGGFILGDEGSGAVLGKKLASLYIKGLLSKGLSQALEEEYKVDKATIIENVYSKPFPNRYLAQFAAFIHRYIDNQEMYSLVEESFSEFMKNNIMQYDKWETYEVGFVGSIAYHFKDIIYQVASDYEIAVNLIEQDPIERLIQYHK